MPREFTRVLVLVSLALVMIGLRTAERTDAQGGLSVVPTTGTYPGAPRSVQVLDVTLPSDQHLWFDRDLCRTFAWKDTDNTTTLANPSDVGRRWAAPDVTVYNPYPFQYSVREGGLWDGEWGGGQQPHFQGYTTTPTSVTFTCDYASLQGNDAAHRYTAAITYTHAQRPAGTGYLFAATITPPAGVTGVGTWVQQNGLGGIGGAVTDLVAWSFDGDGWGVLALPYLHGVDVTVQGAFWGLITHPQGTIVVEQPNAHDPNWLLPVQVSAGAARGFTVAKAPSGTAVGEVYTSDPIAFLVTRASGRAAPQQYLDARYGLLHGWNQDFGLGPQHMPLARSGGGGGQVPFAQLGQLGNWQNGYDRHLDWGERSILLSEAIGPYITTDGTPQGIVGATDLESEIIWPAASDLPGLVPAPNGQTYTLGTLAELKQGLALMRLLGVVGSYWSQWRVPWDETTPGRISHFDLNESVVPWFYRIHPEFGIGCPADCQTRYTLPAYMDWLKATSQQYWLSQGMQGKFMDTSFIVPELGSNSSPLFVDFNIWYLRQNGFIYAEMPQAWYGPLWYNQGTPYAVAGREWGAPFAPSGARFRTCLGIFPARCQQATADLYDVGVEYNLDVARRMHAIGTGWGNSGLDKKWYEYDYEAAGHPGHTAAAKAEALHFSSLQDRYGHPDRIELVNPQHTTNPYAIRLAQDVGPGLSANWDHQPDEVWVHPIYQLPQAGVVQIDSEQILYRKIYSDTGLESGVSPLLDTIRGWNGTTPASHSRGATVSYVGVNPLHWTFDDAYWVYGTGGNERWVRYSDGSVRLPTGASATTPSITNVQIAGAGSSPVVSWTTDVPTTSWVEYDTYGTAEQYNSQRPAGWWPNYLHKTNLDDQGAPPLATTHSRTLPALTPGATYHYSIVARGPAQARTQDATFVAGAAQGPTPTPTGPQATPTPTGTWVQPTALTVQAGQAVTVQWGGFTPTGSGDQLFVFPAGAQGSDWSQGWGSCAVLAAAGSCTLTIPATVAPGSYVWWLLDATADRARSSPVTITAASVTPTPTRTVTPTATRTPTPSPTPVDCLEVRSTTGGLVSTPCA